MEQRLEGFGDEPEKVEQLGMLTEREILEGMTPDQLVNLILAHGEIVSAYEKTMNLASEVLEGVHSVSVEEYLEQKERENEDGTQT